MKMEDTSYTQFRAAPALSASHRNETAMRIHVCVDGQRTTLSVPPSLVRAFEARFGHGSAHAKVRALAAQYPALPGRSRSFRVRCLLEETLADVPTDCPAQLGSRSAQ